MFSDTTNQIVRTAFLLDPADLLDLLSKLAEGQAEEKRVLDLTYEAQRWTDLSIKLGRVVDSL